MNKLFKNKRGNWVDVIEYVGTAFGIGVLVVVMSWFLINFDETLVNVSSNLSIIPDEAVEIATKAATTFPPAFDFILPMIFIFFLVFSVWSARKIPSSFLLVWLYPVIVLILIFLALIAESAWDQFIIDAAFDNVRGFFPVTGFFLNYLRFFVLAYSAFVGWALYAKDE